MYKHSAISIKETNDKMFINSEEKDKISEISTIENDLSIVDKKFDTTNESLKTLEEYIHSNESVLYESKEGSYITVNNSMEGIISDIEILGNTIQDSTNLADIKSVGKLRGDGLYEIELTSCGKNLFDGWLEEGYINSSGGLSNAGNNRYTTDFIRIPKFSTNFIFSRYDATTETMGKGIDLAFYDIDKKFIRNDYSSTAKTRIINAGEGEHFVKITVRNVSDISSLVCQLENGTLSTQYEEYRECKVKIISPCSLEKVGTTNDCIFKGDDNKWYIEKKISRYTCTGLESNITIHDSDDVTQWFLIKNVLNGVDNLIQGNGINTFGFKYHYFNLTGEEHIYFSENGNTLALFINKSKASTIEELREYLKHNKLTVMCKKSLNPDIIELPLDTQIQLNSFFGQTNVFIESGDVDGTIKCSIPKSIGGSINSIVKETEDLTNRIANIETLQEGNDISLSTDKGHVFCEDTRDGYIKDIKIEGNTLVNLVQNHKNGYYNTDGSFTQGTVHIVTFELNIPDSRQITYIWFGKNVSDKIYNFRGIRYIDSDGVNKNLENVPTSYTVKSLQIPSTATKLLLQINNFDSTYPIDINDIKKNIVILEGDHTQNPPTYFEGIKSVGDNKVPLKITSLNGNIFSHINIPAKIGGGNADTVVSDLITYNDGFAASSTVQYYGIHYPFVPLKDGYVYLKYNPTNAAASIWSTNNSTDVPLTQISSNYVKFKCEKGQIYKIGFRCSTTGHFSVRDIDIRYNEISTDYKYSLKDSKQLLYKNDEGDNVPIPILRGIPNSVKDTIEKHSDGKYYYHKRCEEIVFNGSEEWIVNYNVTDHISFITTLSYTVKGSKLISDKFNNILDESKEFIITSSATGKIIIAVNKTKLSSHDIAGFKAWLKSNFVTVVYQLPNEEVYECNNIELNSYVDETLVMVDNIALNPNMSEYKDVITPSKIEFGITSHIGNTLVKMKEESHKNSKFREDMTESITLTKEFNNKYGIIEDTKDGVLSIDKIEGDTLVNLLSEVTPSFLAQNTTESYTVNNKVNYIKVTANSGLAGWKYINFGKINFGLLKPDTTYTLFFERLTGVVLINLCNGSGSEGLLPAVVNVSNGKSVYTFKTKSSLTKSDQILYLGIDYNPTTLNVEASNPILLEGDHSQKPLSYFKGLNSVGELEDLKIESTNANLFDESYIESRLKDDGYYHFSTGSNNTTSTFFFGVYKASDGQMVGSHYPNTSTDLTGHDINDLRIVFGINGNNKDDKITFPLKNIIDCKNISSLHKSLDVIQVDINNYKVKSPMLLFGNKYKPYVKHEKDKKQIMFKNSNGVYEKAILRGLPNGVKDTIEKHSDGKYYYHKRCEEIVYNGSENWDSNGTDNAEYMHFYKIPTKLKAGTCTVSDALTSIDYVDFNKDCVFNSPNHHNIIYVSIQRSKLTAGQTFAGFKAWLQANPLTVVYQLVNEEVYECNNLDLDSFDGDTNIILNNTIPATTIAKIQNNLASTMESIRDRATALEDRLMDLFKIVASGNVQKLAYELYPEDFEPEYGNSDTIISEDIELL